MNPLCTCISLARLLHVFQCLLHRRNEPRSVGLCSPQAIRDAVKRRFALSLLIQDGIHCRRLQLAQRFVQLGPPPGAFIVLHG